MRGGIWRAIERVTEALVVAALVVAALGIVLLSILGIVTELGCGWS